MFRKATLFISSLLICASFLPREGVSGLFDWGPTLSVKADRAQKMLEGIDPVIEKALKDFNVPGMAVGVVVDGHVILAKGYGYRDVEKKLAVSPDTIFPIGSTTKAFGSCLMGMMVEESLLYWDQPVIDILPDFRLWDQYATQNLTLRDLMTHRSGMPRHDFMWYHSGASREELFKRLRYLEPTCDIRERFNYNNLMYMVAGLAMERVGKKSWEELTRQKILKPLKMDRTSFSVAELKGVSDVAKGYVERGAELKKMKLQDVSHIGPAGAMNSTVNDMTHWIQMLLADGVYNEMPLVSQATLEEIMAPQVVAGHAENPEAHLNSYGLGWGIISYRGQYVVSHDGGPPGFTSVVSLVPNKNIGIVILVNKNLVNLARYMSLELMDRILELPKIDWLKEGLEQVLKSRKAQVEGKAVDDGQRKKGTSPTHKLEQYVGDYEHPGYGIVSIKLEDGKLKATHNKIVSTLDHWHYDVFSVAEESEELLISLVGMKYTFRNNINGDVEDLIIPYESSTSDIVFKRKADDQFSSLDYFRQFTGYYEIYSTLVEVAIRDRSLVAIIPGQPIYHLVPTSENEFTVKTMSHYTLRFIRSPAGSIDEALIVLPYGAFTATRKK